MFSWRLQRLEWLLTPKTRPITHRSETNHIYSTLPARLYKAWTSLFTISSLQQHLSLSAPMENRTKWGHPHPLQTLTKLCCVQSLKCCVYHGANSPQCAQTRMLPPIYDHLWLPHCPACMTGSKNPFINSPCSHHLAFYANFTSVDPKFD